MMKDFCLKNIEEMLLKFCEFYDWFYWGLSMTVCVGRQYLFIISLYRGLFILI